MGPIRLNRTTSLNNLVRFLREVGAPVDHGLQRAKLPILFAEQPNVWIPSLRVWAFAHDMARREGIAELGLLAAIKAGEGGGLHREVGTLLWQSPSLDHALTVLGPLARRQTSHIRIWTEDHDDEVLVCHSYQLGHEAPGHYELTWYTIHCFVTIIRHFLGRTWCPNAIFVRAPELRSALPLSIYQSCDVHVGHSTDALSIDRAVLEASIGHTARLPATQSLPTSLDDPPVDFAQSLRYALRPYIGDGYPPIDVMAEIAGCSPRGLQRRLSKSGATYSKLVELARFDTALEVMQDPDTHLGEVALRLGYSDQTAFCRAFRRWTGAAPRAFRRRPRIRGDRPLDASTLSIG